MATRGGEVSDRKDKKDDVRLTDERRIDCPLTLVVFID
jgi:hypothetical protein